MTDKKARTAHTGYTACGFQSNLQVQSSPARAVKVDSEVATKNPHAAYNQCYSPLK
jgi:hypothetical protein